MATVVTALIILGFIGLVISLLMIVHRRDQKRDTAKGKDALGQYLD